MVIEIGTTNSFLSYLNITLFYIKVVLINQRELIILNAVLRHFSSVIKLSMSQTGINNVIDKIIS